MSIQLPRVRKLSPVLLLPLVLTALVLTARVSADEESELDRLRRFEAATVAVVERCRPAFAFIRAIQERDGRPVFGESGGSGFCISPDGLVLTNDHVVAGGNKIIVYLSGGRSYNATVVGRDPQGDVALLKIDDGENLPWLELGDSSAVCVGQQVIAFGDPFLLGRAPVLSAAPASFEPSVSTGIVSAVHRYSDTYNDAIQVDLAVNRGNSGGPLLTMDGKVIGINGKIETRFVIGVNTGVGYAVPTDQIKRFLEPLKRAGGGIVMHGTIRGVRVGVRADARAGLPVTAVVEGSPAHQAGLRTGDLLVRIGGLPVRTANRYKGVLGTYPAGEEVPIEVDRSGKQVALTAILVAPGRPYLGVHAEKGEDSAKVEGVRIREVVPATPAARAGLKPGDVIVAFDGQKVRNTTELAAGIRKHEPGDQVTLSVLRDGKTVEFRVTLIGRL